MSLITRYVLRETAGASLVVIGVLLLILMSNQFAEILGEAAANRLPEDAVFAIFGLTFLRYLTFLTPIGVFLGVLIALARLNRDSEMAALASCGIGPTSLLKPVLILTVALAAGVGWLALVEMPQATARIEQIRFEARERMELSAIEAGTFTSPDSGRTVIYAGRVAGDELHDVFIERERDGRVVVVLAERGERRQDAATGRLSFVLYNGRRYEGRPGDPRFSILEFAEHRIPVVPEDEEELVEGPAMRSTPRLLAVPSLENRAELQWRIASPLSLLVLAVLAIPLSRSSPREGSYARVGIGLLIYISYSNLLSMARVWLERGLAPPWLGLWWVHALVALVTLGLLARHAGWLVRAPRASGAAA